MQEEDDTELDRCKKDILYKTIDKDGPYPRSQGVGLIEPEAFCRLQRIIMRHSYSVLIDSREELMRERIEYFKNGKTNEYA